MRTRFFWADHKDTVGRLVKRPTTISDPSIDIGTVHDTSLYVTFVEFGEPNCEEIPTKWTMRTRFFWANHRYCRRTDRMPNHDIRSVHWTRTIQMLFS